MTAKTAECRWCGMRLQGKPYSMGGNAYHPHSGERAKINHYGGFVCSKTCDRRASLDLEQSMPGHGIGQKKLSCYAEAALERNWA